MCICRTPGTATSVGEPTGKVRQLDQLYPHLREEEPAPRPTSTIAAPVEHLDLATVIKVSQAVSGEIVLEKLIDTLMRTAIEHAGAERGLLIRPRGDELQIEAEATTSGDTVIVRLPEASVAATPTRVDRPLCRAHPGERDSRRCLSPEPVCRGCIHPSTSRPFHSLLAIAQAGQTDRNPLPRKQPDPPCLHAGPDGGPQTARFGGGDLTGKHPSL